MDKLWAPWRIGYIKNINKEKGCLFCRVLKSRKDKKNLVFYRSKYCFAMLNLYPYNNGHILIVANSHVKSIELLKEGHLTDLIKTTAKVKLWLDKTLKPDGYNIGMNIGRIAGAGFDKHLHMHIVPRWSGDTNFMPSVAGTKIISQSLNNLYENLVKNKP